MIWPPKEVLLSLVKIENSSFKVVHCVQSTETLIPKTSKKLGPELKVSMKGPLEHHYEDARISPRSQ